MQIQRHITKEITEKLVKGDKAIILYGPRQTGKTTLCNTIIKELGLKTLSINADEQRYIDVLASRDSRKLMQLVSGYELLFLDEAQRVPNIGINLKILIDQVKELKILATGSSSFELANKIAEPLTGRTWTYHLYPIAELELAKHANHYELQSQLEDRLIWGSYPEIFRLSGYAEKEQYMRQLASDYLYRDLLTFNGIRHADKIRNVLKLLAFQIGNEVSLNELARQLEMSKETVARYLDLLEKTFVLFRLTGFSRNLRKEVTKMNKYYFYDVGIRNAVIDNFKPLDSRNDVGHLWENFFIMERVKRNAYTHHTVTPYFWRTYTGAEIDYIEEGEGKLDGFECKWGKEKSRAPKAWNETYANATWTLVHQDNWLEFVL